MINASLPIEAQGRSQRYVTLNHVTSNTNNTNTYFSDLFQWAEVNRILPTTKAIYYALGLDACHQKAMQANHHTLVKEFAVITGQPILKKWQFHPTVQELVRFSKLFQESDSLKKKYPPFGHAGSEDQARKQFPAFEKQTYLLTLLTFPLVPALTEEDTKRRQMLRLWITIQHFNRVFSQGYIHDSKISSVARYLILGPYNLERWQFIDILLTKTAAYLFDTAETFQDTNYALIQAAESMLGIMTLESHQRSFLNNVISIAQDERNPIQFDTGNHVSEALIFNVALPEPHVSNITQDTDIEEDQSHILSIAKLPDLTAIRGSEEEAIDQENTALLITARSDGLTEPEQVVESRSIHIQTIEDAHYLPWGWNGVLPSEQNELDHWLTASIQSHDPITSLLASFIKLATYSGRSLLGILTFKIQDQSVHEWSLDEQFSNLHRFVVHRQNAWRPSQDQKKLIAPFTEILSLHIPNDVSIALNRIKQSMSFKPTSLTDLWLHVSPNETIDVCFNRLKPETLQRLTSAMFRQELPSLIFNKLGDHHLARIISSPAKTALPGGCGYASWDIETIEKGLPLSLGEPVSELNKTIHIAGSLLVPDEDFLKDKIQQAEQRLIKDNYSFIEYHNLYTQYVAAILYAATGHRYLRDPFESLCYFNLESGFAFINDKTDDQLHTGRLVPLPEAVLIHLKNYLEHLQKLQNRLLPIAPELSTAIQDLLNRMPSSLPLLFLLTEDLQWKSLSDVDPAHTLFNWILPNNLFRHRYSQQLQAVNIPMDIIDSWMGHLERGFITYGDLSPRCWLKDAELYKTKIDQIFDCLEFPFIQSNIDYCLLSIDASSATGFKKKSFGSELRKRQRSAALKKAIKVAKKDIHAFLNGRSFNNLNNQDIQKLVYQMLLVEGQIGHHFAGVRLNVLKKEIKKSGGKPLEHIRHLVIPEEPPRSALSSDAISAHSLFPKLKKWSEKVEYGRNLGSKAAAALRGTILFAIEKRVGYSRLLYDLLLGKNFRLLQYKSRLFLEYSESLDIDDHYAPVQRHEISYRVASSLDLALERKTTLSTDAVVSFPELLNLKRILSLEENCNSESVIDALSQVINQSNLIDLPGMVAAVLSGRILTTSLPFQDQLRTTDRAYQYKELDSTSVNSVAFQNIFTARKQEKDTNILLQNAEEFKRAITAILSDYIPSRSQDVAILIEKRCSDYEGKISHAVLLVGYWIAYVIRRGKGHGHKHVPLAESTVKTYYASLMVPFHQFAYQTNLQSLDSDDLTELYLDMLDHKESQREFVDYFGARLHDFHRWATKHGIAEPNWHELNIQDDRRTVRAGFITEADYQTCLERLYKPKAKTDHWLLLSFVLILTYRFGLRSKEATGLRAQDLCERDDMLWVLVRNNRQRKLKTTNSRRAVPLLFPITETEREVIKRIRTRYSSIAGNNSKFPLLCEPSQQGPITSQYHDVISPKLIQLLREVTGSQNLVLHHCRHSFHNRAAAILLGDTSDLSKHLLNNINVDAVREIVLGEQHDVSRRSSMALARLMGHRHASTGMQNYNHLLLDWADSLTPVQTIRAHKLKHAWNNESLIRYIPPKTKLRVELNFAEINLFKVFQILRLASMGFSFEEAGSALSVSPVEVVKLSTLIEHASHKMIFNARGEDGTIHGSERPYLLLEFISDQAWQRLLNAAQNVDEAIIKKGNIPTLEELPSLVSKTRQLFMESDQHCSLVKLLIQVFSLQDNNYSIVAANDNSDVANYLGQQGFNVVSFNKGSSQKTKIAVDVFDQYNGLEIIGTRKKYGVLNIFRNQEGILRNSNELALAFLCLGFVANQIGHTSNN